ncbi:MAG: M81 family metallopeptidase [Kiloniellaceae bacterium]
MARIAIGGFQHETNTFAPCKATFEDFATPSGWPGLTRGEAIFEAVAGINVPIAGFIAAARELGHELLPLAWAAATPSAHVTEAAFERIAGQILEDLAKLSDLDAVYLDLHGAMVSEHYQDGEGEILRRVRARVGPQMPVAASLDLHANITPEMVARAHRLVAYRTYPHIDMARTGARAARQVDALLRDTGPDGPAARFKAFRKLGFLIPLQGGCTMLEPAKSLYARLEQLEVGEVGHLSLACGFGPADIWHCGPSVVAYGTSQAAADRAADTLYEEIAAREPDFAVKVWRPERAVAHAMERSKAARRPVILADSQDNPGGGAESDTVGLLEELLAQDARDTALAILHDPEAAAAAHAAGEGAEITVPLGAKSGLPGHRPLKATYRIERLGDGRFTGTGPFYLGARMQLGPMALLRVRGVKIVVGSRKLQAADQAIFRHLGVEPAERKILALKSSVHFRADFQPIAEEILVVAAPGPNALDYRELDYRNLRPGLRLMPLGPAFAPDAA